MIYHLPQRKLTEQDIDAQIDARRAEYDAAMEAESMGLGLPACRGDCAQGDRPCETPAECVTDATLFDYILRSAKEWLRSVQFKVRVWLACRGKPPF